MAIILNVSAGTQGIEPLHQQIKEICHEYAMDVRFFLVYPGTDIHQITKKALYEQYAIIVAAGGDGTVSAVARELAGTPVILGILPLGTLNHFAKDIQNYQKQMVILEDKRKRIFEMREDGSYSPEEFKERKEEIENKIMAVKISLSETKIEQFDIEGTL